MSRSANPIFDYPKDHPEINSQDFFLRYQYITELNLATYPNYFIPLSVSQCQLIETVNLSDTTFSQPPAILFTLPQIRAHPEKILLGDEQVCTRSLMLDILAGCKYYQSFSMKFKDPQQEGNQYSIISFSPETTVLDFILLTHPKLAIYIQYFALVRTIQHKNKAHRLFLLPDEMPLVLYQYPGATWSIELRSTPTYELPTELEPYVDFYIQRLSERQTEPIENKPRTEPTSYLNYIPTFKISLKVNKAVKEGQITVSNSTISLSVGSSTYYVFENRNVHLAFITGKYLLFFGKKALVLESNCISNLLPFFEYTIHPFFFPRKSKEDESQWNDLVITTDSFAEIAVRAQILSMSVKIQGNEKRTLPNWQKDNIEVLKSFRSTSLPFVKQTVQKTVRQRSATKKMFKVPENF